MTTNKQDNVTHLYAFSSTAISFEYPLQYQYQITFTNQSTLVETFWRKLEPCRLLSESESLWITKYEYFEQQENYLGLCDIPILDSKQKEIPKPFYYDDNQVMTLSFHIPEEDLTGIIFNPNDRGEIYVKANLTMISLTNRDYYESMKIRRAGGVSLTKYPYSYQIKFDHTDNGISKEVVIKLKAYPIDYERNEANIIAEKASVDICTSVGAPINYVSFVRVIINGEFQGIYGMLEKVDDAFVERRWPYITSNDQVGTLYKTQQSHWYLLTNSTWQSGIPEFCSAQAESASSCCPCFENDCDVDSDCDEFDDDDEICQTLSCCQCTWESNGSVDIQSANCVEQTPFQDFIDLGDTLLDGSFAEISKILNPASYVQSSLCALAVMNADGYVYNGKNYYWYRDTVTGEFFLILYDQDTSFTRQSYVNENWTPWDWTMKGNLSDALFLSTLLQDNDLLEEYNTLVSKFVSEFYRPDKTGPLYQRMKTLADYLAKYNPGRAGVQYKTEGFIDWFITPQSQRMSE
eukprot:CAMPEP_0117082680 /NCGR_PEP_ID=MMETSP0472-20121206/58220_1 /TAXON_ID=693140 ORGANISM="Tiarina fusus, Strain LIS" /NCGR_SAMPLE_ID=MMETSP0472 /ASSEMBLY_ACC=CAM_ASM_000603 /LENGTH=519 /DNA_ID=CAMNT_0004811011 /DNA_START=177 /DNA_END=1733 /DNA_ORIENTATION=-